MLCEDRECGVKPHGANGKADLIEFTIRRRRRVIRSMPNAELKGLVDSIQQMLLLQCTLHQIYCGTAQTRERMIDLLEGGLMYPPLDICADARATYDAIAATDACEPAGSNLKLHLISIRKRMAYGLIRKLLWVDTRDMLADGAAKCGIGRMLLHNVSNDCKYRAAHEALMHTKHSVGSTTKDPPGEDQ